MPSICSFLHSALASSGDAAVDALHDLDGFVDTAADRGSAAELAGGPHIVAEHQAFDRLVAPEIHLRALALNEVAIRLQNQMYRLSHAPCISTRPRASQPFLHDSIIFVAPIYRGVTMQIKPPQPALRPPTGVAGQRRLRRTIPWTHLRRPFIQTP
jgi:hypothetical protein